MVENLKDVVEKIADEVKERVLDAEVMTGQPDPKDDVAARQHREAKATSGQVNASTQHPNKTNALEIDAYGIGDHAQNGEEASAQQDWEAHLKKKRELEEGYAIQENIPGLNEGVHGTRYEDENGYSAIMVVDANGNGLSISNVAPDSKWTHDATADGKIKISDKASDASMVMGVAGESGYYLDASNWTDASVDYHSNMNGKHGSVHISVDKEGRAEIQGTKGTPEPGIVFIKGRDGGIRTNDSNGELVLANPRALPKEISRADKNAHKEFLKKAEQNPELIDLQGAPAKTDNIDEPDIQSPEQQGEQNRGPKAPEREPESLAQTMGLEMGGAVREALESIASPDSPESPDAASLEQSQEQPSNPTPRGRSGGGRG